MNKIYADVTEDDLVNEPNFQWVVLATEVEDREAALTEQLFGQEQVIENLTVQEAALRDERDALQQRLTATEQRAGELKKLLCDVINEAPSGFAALKVDLANRVNDALKPAAEG